MAGNNDGTCWALTDFNQGRPGKHDLPGKEDSALSLPVRCAIPLGMALQWSPLMAQHTPIDCEHEYKAVFYPYWRSSVSDLGDLSTEYSRNLIKYVSRCFHWSIITFPFHQPPCFYSSLELTKPFVIYRCRIHQSFVSWRWWWWRLGGGCISSFHVVLRIRGGSFLTPKAAT